MVAFLGKNSEIFTDFWFGAFPACGTKWRFIEELNIRCFWHWCNWHSPNQKLVSQWDSPNENKRQKGWVCDEENEDVPQKWGVKYVLSNTCCSLFCYWCYFCILIPLKFKFGNCPKYALLLLGYFNSSEMHSKFESFEQYLAWRYLLSGKDQDGEIGCLSYSKEKCESNEEGEFE